MAGGRVRRMLGGCCIPSLSFPPSLEEEEEEEVFTQAVVFCLGVRFVFFPFPPPFFPLLLQ